MEILTVSSLEIALKKDARVNLLFGVMMVVE